ncbi:glutathione peroxidase [Cognatitamlana onchidii]|uniref:glutathione peroxidase n=1 Tax=Cognatitamlana onchidii TaxID=2562860 RepID=UPI0010A60542|nr:glutathione peroxidase [Algibacter onchidii]
MNTLKAFFATINANTGNTNTSMQRKQSIYDIAIKSLTERPINLNDFKGKYLLIVNVASKCGFTPQYKDLQSLYDQYQDTLEIIGVPCNQFGKQEPDNANKIQDFCQINYGVNFTLTEKANVKGSNQHPLYAWLTQKSLNGKTQSSVKWNFQKYLVSPEGELVDFFYSTTAPLSHKITKHLK